MLALRTTTIVIATGASLGVGAAKPANNVIRPPAACIPRAQCCRICPEGKACGNWCTKAIFSCEKVRGCACDASKVCR